jgi:hypothetical protein
MIPEQVWDENPPSGQTGSHPAREAGQLVERPRVVACRYGGC